MGVIYDTNTSRNVILSTKFSIVHHFTLFWYFLVSNLMNNKF